MSADYPFLRHTSIEAAEVDETVLEEFQRVVDAKESTLLDLREELTRVESERKSLEQRVDGLQTENERLSATVESLRAEVGDETEPDPDALVERFATLEDGTAREAFDRLVSRLDEQGVLDTDAIADTGTLARPTLPAPKVFSGFQEAVATAQQAESGFTVKDLSVDLRAEVGYEDDQLKFRFPELSGSDGLSDLRFRVAPQPETEERDYEDVPDLSGTSREAAERLLGRRGFVVGTVETDPEEPAGVVVDQFPGPFTVAEPGAAVDLVVGGQTAEEPDGEAPVTEPDETEAASGARVDDFDVIHGIGKTYEQRLYDAGIRTYDELAAADPEQVASVTGAPRSRAERWLEEASERSENG